MDDVPNRDSSKQRARWFAGVSLVCVAVGVGYVWYAARRSESYRNGLAAQGVAARLPEARSSASASSVTLADVTAGPYVAYRSARDGEFGRVVLARLDALEEKRFVTDLVCERVDFDRRGGACMIDNRNELFPPAYLAFADTGMKLGPRADLAGYPSRTRLSPDGRFAASTVFTAGEDYEAEFTTRTTIAERGTGHEVGELEQYAVFRDGQRIRAVDFNFWGVTFMIDANAFYATLATAGKTYLVRGDVSKEELHTVRENVECPSLSPDGKRLGFKRRDADGKRRLHVLDLATLRDVPVLAAPEPIDDQVEWLDDEHLLYGSVASVGRPAEAMNVWVVSVAGGERRRYLAGASSPSVVR